MTESAQIDPSPKRDYEPITEAHWVNYEPTTKLGSSLCGIFRDWKHKAPETLPRCYICEALRWRN